MEHEKIVSRDKILKTLNENGITCSVRFHILNKSFIHPGLLFSLVYYPFIIILTTLLQQYIVLGIISSVVVAITVLLFSTLYTLEYVQREKFKNNFPWKSHVFSILWKQGYTDRALGKIELHMKFPIVLNV